MVTDEKEKVMRAQLDSIYEKIDANESLNTWEQMAFDIYSWLLEDSDEPSLED